MKQTCFPYLIVISLLIISGCSTEKNTALSRGFHGLNAHYNGYFNANELINQAMDSYQKNLQEDYYEILAIDPVPSKHEVDAFTTPLDTAIAKCKKVITDHSMPSNDKPSRKDEEHNKWIDENWTTIGIAQYYKRDYEGAMKSFKFIRKFFKNDPSIYIGELWMAKTHIQQGKYTEAKFNLDKVEKGLQESKEKQEKKKQSKAAKLNKRGGGKKQKKLKFPKKILFDYEKTRATLALIEEDKEGALQHLKKALDLAKKSEDKGRMHFILAQLYEDKGDFANASHHYSKSKKKNIPYQMSFNAKLRSVLFSSESNKRKQLNKMLRDAKNAPYKDQIYYTLGEMELADGNEPKAVEHYTSSAFYSTNNTRQKGMAYEKMGDLRFAKRDYIRAQKYYDSCATVITDEYPDAEVIRSKADNLANLVVAVEAAKYEDSVQRIAQMEPKAQEKFIESVIQQIKEEEKRKKQREAEKLRLLQQSQNLFVQNIGNSSKWYWNNAKSRSEGYQEFVRLWGDRENEDHWRRSEKIQAAEFTEAQGDSLQGEDSVLVEEPEDTLTVEYLAEKLPQTEEEMDASNKRLLKSWYDAGIIYKEQLNENEFATKNFNNILHKKVASDYNVMAAFQLYKIHQGNATQANKQKDYILTNYPNSDYANYLRDPDYFVKKKERDALAEQEYVRVLERYNKGLYYPVLSKASQVIEEEKDNVFRAKYMLLKAMSMGQTMDEKDSLLPILNAVIDEYPETMEATKAAEMIEIIQNGYSEWVEADFSSDFVFEYDEDARQIIMVLLKPEDNIDIAKNKIVSFNREFFPDARIKVSSKLFKEKSIVMLQDFETESEAKAYKRKYRDTRKHLLDLQNAELLIITAQNVGKLYETGDVEQYKLFFEEYY